MNGPDVLPADPPRNRLVGPMPKIGIRPRFVLNFSQGGGS